MNSKSINEITLFRYLYELDNRNLPQSIITWYENHDSDVSTDRENAIREISGIRGNCRKLVVNLIVTILTNERKPYLRHSLSFVHCKLAVWIV